MDKDAYLAVLSRYIHLNPVRVKAMEKVPREEKIRYLTTYPWSSLPGYLSRRKREEYIDYTLVLAAYGGDTDRARQAYREALYLELAAGIEIKDKVCGQSILGSEGFIEWVMEKFLSGEKDRERPSLKEIHTYRAKDVILKAVEQEAGKGVEEIIKEKGVYRQVLMELLYRVGGLKGQEIGKIMGVGYTSVSQERRRLRQRLAGDRKLAALIARIEQKCH